MHRANAGAGSVGRGGPSRATLELPSVGEYIHVLEAGEVEGGAGREEFEAARRQARAALAGQHRVEPLPSACGGAGRPRRHRRAAAARRVRAAQSELCCCFDNSTPSSSAVRSLRPCLSV